MARLLQGKYGLPLAGAVFLVLMLGTLLVGRSIYGQIPAPALETPVTIPLPAGVHFNQVVISPDGAHLAFTRTREDGRQCVVFDGKDLADYPAIRAPWQGHRRGCLPEILPGLFFSPDGKRLAYEVAVGKQWAVVVDGKQGKAYDDLDIPIFSPDFRRMAYAAKTGDAWRMVLDGVAGKPYLSFGTGRGFAGDASTIDPVFSPDSKHLVYTARRMAEDGEYRSYLIFDGKEFGPYGMIQGLTFSTVGARYGYAAWLPDGSQIVVIDGKASRPFKRVSPPAISPDGERFAYLAEEMSGRTLFVLDGEEEPIGPCSFQPPLFSPNSVRVAYIAKGKEGQDALRLDGATVAFAGMKDDAITRVTFSPDSQRVAYIAGKRLHLVGEQDLPGEFVHWGLTFSQDSQRLAYVASYGKRRNVMLGDRSYSISGDWAYFLTFSPDSAHLIYAAPGPNAEDRSIRVYVDGTPGETYEALLPFPYDRGPRFFFDAPDHFHYFAFKDGTIHRVDAKLPVVPNPLAFLNTPAPAMAVHLEPLPGNETISAYEPLLVNFRVENTGRQTIELPAWCTEYTLRLEVYDGQGRLRAATLHPPIPLDFLHSLYRLQPGSALETTLVISSLFTFTEPGQYIVRARQLALDNAIRVLVEDDAQITVLPFDADRLQARCDASRNAKQSKTLYSVRHNLALPALIWMAHEWHDVYACRAIKRIGTPEAERALRQLVQEGGQVGKAASSLDAIPARINMWDIAADVPQYLTVNPQAALLRWEEEGTGNIFFTSIDIRRFDWDKQVFEMTEKASKRLQALPQQQHRYLLLKDREGLIYRGTLYSPFSSIGFAGPAIRLYGASGDITPPAYRIEAWCGGANPPGPDLRFNSRLEKALREAGIFYQSKPAK
ncbi:MAG: WD40 repeat domain-containing protein [Armatimonadota bacterium]